MIQFVPFCVAGPDGQAQALAERAARQATAWVARYGLVVRGAPAVTTNVVVGLADRVTFYYTLTICVEIEGAVPAPWGDPAEPPEWKALGQPPAQAPIPPAAPADTAEGVEAARLAAQGKPTPTPPAPSTPQAPRPLERPAAAPAIPPSVRPGGTITDPQLRAIYTIGRKTRGWSEAQTDAAIEDKYHCKPGQLSKTAASEAITWLQEVA